MKKFGLIIPDKKKTPSAATSFNIKKPAAVAALFDDNESVEEDVLNKKPVNITTSITSSDQFTQKLHQEALQEDPNVFDYDAAIDVEEEGANLRRGIHKNSRLSSTLSESKEVTCRAPKYMQNLLAKAEERKIENELVRLRNMKRKAGTLNNTTENTEEEVFITDAYSEKLKELEAKEVELKARQTGLEDGDVTKLQDMSQFYFNLMKRNVSFGGSSNTKIQASSQSESGVKRSKSSQVHEELNYKNIIETTTSTEPKVKSEIQSEDEEEEKEEEVSFGPIRPKGVNSKK